jgi:AcrR family transcriptional regulator
VAITDAVLELLSVRRLDELTVQEIVDRAQISRPTFYAHFETKYSVVAALIAEMGETIFERWAPFFAEDGPIREETLRELGVLTLRGWRERATLFSATIEGWHSDHEIHDTWNAVLDRFVANLTRRLAKVRPLQPDDDMVVTALINVFERCVYLAVATPDSPLGRSDEELAGVLAMMWMRSLRLDEFAAKPRRRA